VGHQPLSNCVGVILRYSRRRYIDLESTCTARAFTACRSQGVTLCLSRYRVGGREQPYERKTPLEVPSAQLGATVLFPPTPRYVKPNPRRPQGRPPAPEQIPRDLFTHLAMSSVLRKAGHRTLLGGAAFCDAGDASLEGTPNPSMSTGMHLPRNARLRLSP